MSSSSDRYEDNSFIFPYDFVTSGLFKSKIQALFLLDLIDLAARSTTIKDGWFLCTVKHLEESLRWKKTTQTELLHILKKRRFIKTEQRGRERTRWIWIDIARIERQLHRLTSTTESGE